jgi:predicted DNA binding CopG/RHH family protein
MGKSNKRIDPLPEHFSSLEEAGEFWDTHDTTDYEEYMRPVHFEVDLKRSVHEVRIADEVLREVSKVARRQGLKTETLINLWLQQRLATNGKPSRRTAERAARKRPAKATRRLQNGMARSNKG